MKMIHPDSAHEIEVDEVRAGMYRSQGWREPETDAPRGNAPLADWQDFARAKGFTDEEIEGKTRAELRAALA